MKYVLLLSFSLLSFISSYAQYNDPYRMTYDGNSYYVTNKGNGTVTKIDSAGNTSTVISGLFSPNDIFYGSVAGNSVILILDSNTIKIYDSATLGSLLNLPIAGAQEAHDGVFNPSNTNEFFISDRGGNKIIKGSIGSAPFYPITYSTLTSGLSKPTGMIFNRNGKLIVVSDTIVGKVYEVDVSNGNKTVVLNSTRNYLNDIAQDNEGNYYITNWGNDRLYRYSSTWSNETSVNSYNNPSGLYANTSDGLMGIACTNCQKVEFSFFHLFSPSNDVVTCTSDSFNVFTVPSFRGIGTYLSGNEFHVEMSDSNGSFSSPTILATELAGTPPAIFRCGIPQNRYADSGYRYRLRSTLPPVISYFTKELKILTPPATRLGGTNSYSGCVNTDISVTLPIQTDVTYTFTPSTAISETSPGNYVVNQGMDTTLAIHLLATNTSTGCISTDSIVASISDSLTISGLADSIAFCEGDTVVLSPDKATLKYYWSITNTLTNLQENSFSAVWDSLRYSDITPKLQTIYLHAKDNAGCRGIDSVKITVNNTPKLAFTLQELEFCIGDTLFRDYSDDSLNYSYHTPSQIPLSPSGWLADTIKRSNFTLTYSYKTTGCSNTHGNGYGVHYKDDSIRISNEGSHLKGTVYGSAGNLPMWIVNNQAIASGDTLNVDRLEDGDTIYAVALNNTHCRVFSNGIVWQQLGTKLPRIDFSLFPNPSNGSFTVESGIPLEQIQVFDISGKLVFRGNESTIFTKLEAGIYYVHVITKYGSGSKKLIVYD